MPRTSRLDFEGARHHVMNRGARRAPVLGNDEARRLFLDVLAELPDQLGVRIHGYAVMPNHYHLLLETPRANLGETMRRLGGEFTQRLNRRHGWDGPVFRGRFKNRVAGDLRYWMHLLAYLHLNPVAAGMVHRPEEAEWTSHRAYLGLCEAPPWLTTAEMYRLFGGASAIAAYVNEHQTGRGTAPEGWDPRELWRPTPTLVALSHAPQPAAGLPPHSTRTAIAEVAQATGCSEERLLSNKRGRRDNRPRWVAAWWLSRRSGLTHRQIGRVLGCQAASVSQILGRLRAHSDDDELAGWLAALEERSRPPSPQPQEPEESEG